MRRVPFGYCIYRDTGEHVITQDVLLKDSGPVHNSSCVYIATDSVGHPKTQKFIETVRSETGARLITYGDIDRSSPACHGISPSILEQSIQSRIPGRFVASWPSTWDEIVLIQRAQHGLAQADEELELFRRMMHALLVFRKKPRTPFELVNATANDIAR